MERTNEQSSPILHKWLISGWMDGWMTHAAEPHSLCTVLID